MPNYSFIDSENRDFVRYLVDREIVTIDAPNVESAEDWLLTNGDAKTDWTNTGTRFWCWDDDEED